jgi:YVTN family beta-propeller protein
MKQAYRWLLFCALLSLVAARVGWAEIFVMLENPIQSQKVSGVSVISGWAFSDQPGAQVSVRLFVNGTDLGLIPCCVERADVQAEFPGQPQALNSGFGQVVNFNLLPDTATIAIAVSDTAGSAPQNREAQVTAVKPGGFQFLSQLDLLFSDSVGFHNDQTEIEIAGVIAREKGTSNSAEVTIRLAWQENLQNLGIVHSETTTQSEANLSAADIQESTRSQTADDTPAIQLMLENPPAQRSVSGIGAISGWTFSSTPDATITSVRQRIDGNTGGAIPCCAARADVQAAFPKQPQSLQSGFGALANFNLLPSGSHTIGVEVQDSTNASRIVDNPVTVVKLGNFEFIDRFDLSEADAFINGTNLEIDNLKIRDKPSQQEQTIDVRYAWQESCQCFVAQASCGNGNIEPGEECDGVTLGGATCSSRGFSGGTLGCTLSCEFDTSQCEGGPRAYITNVRDNSVTVVSTATNAVEETIQVGREPRGIAISPDAASAYVTNSRDNTVSVIDLTTNTVIGEPIPVGRSPQGVAFSPHGTKAYVVNGLGSSVSVINTATRAVEVVLPVGREPQAVALTPDGTRAYVSNFADNSVTVLNLGTNSAETTIALGNKKGPNGIAVSPDGRSVYVVNFNDDSVSVIDTAMNQVIDTVEVSFLPAKVAFSPDGTRAFVSNSLDYTVSIIDTATRNVINAVFVGVDPYNDVLNEPDGVAVTPNGDRVYVAIYGRGGLGSYLRVFSSITNRLVAFTEIGKGPFAVAVTPARP